MAPDLRVLRDAVFYFRLMMCPARGALPEPRAWRPRDGVLRWTFLSEAKGFEVRAFGGRPLRVAPPTASSAAVAERGGSMLSYMQRLWRREEAPRAPPSNADASALLRAAGCEGGGVASEEDVLLVRSLPSFGGRLSAHLMRAGAVSSCSP